MIDIQTEIRILKVRREAAARKLGLKRGPANLPCKPHLLIRHIDGLWKIHTPTSETGWRTHLPGALEDALYFHC